ncbi:hypothetical protein HH308_06310 [Gordonia sp. TBRC 11910]|uniref:Uncharacterized protein n=1 Tax=Gordonia asplenii TaxID=2725283 RepID=A0A848KVD1_9ACTN|nr:hypothetical protein [Gordonia asplenii]NMO00825.1 hypothetical protein [Gordonia asplenii]
MPTTCWPSIRGLAMRLTKVDSCGAPIVGPKSTIESDGYVSAKVTLEYEDGESTNQKNAAGKLCVVDQAPAQLKNASVELAFCGVNPDLLVMTTGQDLVVDEAGNGVGVSIGDPTFDAFWALEMWSDVPGAACGAGARPFGYFLLPFFTAAKLGDFTIEEKLANFSVTATTKRGNGWGVGPYDVTLQPAVAPALPAPGPLLTALSADKHLHMQEVKVPPPTTLECAAKALAA